MERIKKLIRPRERSYEALPEQRGTHERHQDEDEDGGSVKAKREGSTFEYVVFALVGVAMYVFPYILDLVIPMDVGLI